MRSILIMLLVVLSATALAPAQAGQDPNAKVEQELRDIVRRWDEAYVKGDTATLNRLLADEFAFVGGPKKTEYLDSFKSRNVAIESAVSTGIEVQVYGNTAVLIGLDTITGKNKSETFVTKWLYMDVWIKRDGRWQCVKTYSTPAQNH